MEPTGRVLDGNLETLGLQSTLKMLALGGKTGILYVSSGPEQLAIYLDNGSIIDLDEPGTQPPNLAEMFRLLGYVPRPQAIELSRLAGANPSIALDIMQQWGVFSAADTQKWREFRIIQALSRAIRWESGRFEFQSVQPMRRDGRQPLNVDHALLEALRTADEWGKNRALALTRNTVARWMPEFKGDVAQLHLNREEIGALCLSNGQFPLSHIAFALLVPEPAVAELMHHLLELGLIEVVDARLQTELEHSLIDLLSKCQHLLSQDARATPEQHMVTLVRTMGTCVNGLFEHHAIFARGLRGRGEVPAAEVARFLDESFAPILTTLQRDYPRMDEVIRLNGGKLDFGDVLTLDKVVRGPELNECYWDAIGLLSQLMRAVFDKVLNDEIGGSRVGRQFEDLWNDFLREIDQEITRLTHGRARGRVQNDRAGTPQGAAPESAVAYAYDMASDPRRRWS
jgi:hypothetical protein